MSFYKTNAVLIVNNGLTDVTLELCIKTNKRPDVVDNPGLNNINLHYVGNFVRNASEPLNKSKIFPNFVKVGTKGIINVDNGTIQGDWIFSDIQRSRYKQVEAVLGQTFIGYILPKKVTNDSDWT